MDIHSDIPILILKCGKCGFTNFLRIKAGKLEMSSARKPEPIGDLDALFVEAVLSNPSKVEINLENLE